MLGQDAEYRSPVLGCRCQLILSGAQQLAQKTECLRCSISQMISDVIKYANLLNGS